MKLLFSTFSSLSSLSFSTYLNLSPFPCPWPSTLPMFCTCEFFFPSSPPHFTQSPLSQCGRGVRQETSYDFKKMLNRPRGQLFDYNNLQECVFTLRRKNIFVPRSEALVTVKSRSYPPCLLFTSSPHPSRCSCQKNNRFRNVLLAPSPYFSLPVGLHMLDHVTFLKMQRMVCASPRDGTSHTATVTATSRVVGSWLGPVSHLRDSAGNVYNLQKSFTTI